MRTLQTGWGLFWLQFHLVGTLATLLTGSTVVMSAYAALFIVAELYGLKSGHPMTAYVHAAIAWAREWSRWYLAGTATGVLLWCGLFVDMFVDYGPLPMTANAILSGILFEYLLPHFFGKTW